MSLSPIQDLFDRLHLMLVSELPTLSSTIPQIIKNPDDPLTINNSIINTVHSTLKSDLVIIDQLQQYIKKIEREREIRRRCYSIILQLLKHNDIDNKTNFIDYNYSELLHND